MRLILASHSPRRLELLKRYTSDFIVVCSDVKELVCNVDPHQLAIENAQLKAMDVFSNHQDDCVLGADTIVYHDSKIFHKPKSLDDAKSMLRQLSGRTHEVITGVCVVSKDTQKVFSVSTSVTFKHLENTTIDRYLSLIDYSDKAGSYAIQEHADLIVESYQGSLTNVIGLPIEAISAYFLQVNDVECLNSMPQPQSDIVYKTSVRAVIKQDDTYGLLETLPYAIQNRTHPFAETTGGGILFCETTDSGLRREIFEELGYQLESCQWFAKYHELVEYEYYKRCTIHNIALITVSGEYDTSNRLSYEHEMLGDIVFKTLDEWQDFFDSHPCSDRQARWKARDLAAINKLKEMMN